MRSRLQSPHSALGNFWNNHRKTEKPFYNTKKMVHRSRTIYIKRILPFFILTIFCARTALTWTEYTYNCIYFIVFKVCSKQYFGENIKWPSQNQPPFHHENEDQKIFIKKWKIKESDGIKDFNLSGHKSTNLHAGRS